MHRATLAAQLTACIALLLPLARAQQSAPKPAPEPPAPQALASAALVLSLAGREEAAKPLFDRAVELGRTESGRPLAAAGALHACGVRAAELRLPDAARQLVEAALAIRHQRARGSRQEAD